MARFYVVTEHITYEVYANDEDHARDICENASHDQRVNYEVHDRSVQEVLDGKRDES